MTPLDMLKNIIKAWDSLPTGDYYGNVIEEWLSKDMKPAIDKCREVVENTDANPS